MQVCQASIAKVYQKLDWNVYIDFITEMYMYISYSYTELSKFYYTFGKQYMYICGDSQNEVRIVLLAKNYLRIKECRQAFRNNPKIRLECICIIYNIYLVCIYIYVYMGV